MHVANEYVRDLETDSESRGNCGSGFVQKSHEAATNDAASGQGNAHGSRRFNGGSCSRTFRVRIELRSGAVTVGRRRERWELVERRAAVDLELEPLGSHWNSG